MRAYLPRILYLLAVLTWALMLWPNPVTIFLAACFSSLTIPVYRHLRKRATRWRARMEQRKPLSKVMRLLFSASHIMPVTVYTCFIISCLLIPLATLALLVSPQAVAGYARLKQLQASNFQLPPAWLEYIESAKRTLAEYPQVEKIINDSMANLDTFFNDAITMLVSRSFGFVGSTMNALWLLFLFFTLTVIFSVQAGLIRKITGRMLNVPPRLLKSFLEAIHSALKAITLGIVLVALVQGVMCGVGFAVAGVSQPAFWGLLATMVAPIPMVGTALVWGPLAISLWFSGSTIAAVGLAIWGAFFVAGIDNVLRPFFLRQGIEASFFVLIISILCGLSVFGAVGLIAGPVLLAVGMRAYEEADAYYRPNS